MCRRLGGLSLVGKEGLCSWEADRWPIFKPLFGGKGCPDLNSQSCFDSSVYRYADWFGCVALNLNSNYQDAQIHNAVEGLGMISLVCGTRKGLQLGNWKVTHIQEKGYLNLNLHQNLAVLFADVWVGVDIFSLNLTIVCLR